MKSEKEKYKSLEDKINEYKLKINEFLNKSESGQLNESKLTNPLCDVDADSHATIKDECKQLKTRIQVIEDDMKR